MFWFFLFFINRFDQKILIIFYFTNFMRITFFAFFTDILLIYSIHVLACCNLLLALTTYLKSLWKKLKSIWWRFKLLFHPLFLKNMRMLLILFKAILTKSEIFTNGTIKMVFTWLNCLETPITRPPDVLCWGSLRGIHFLKLFNFCWSF